MEIIILIPAVRSESGFPSTFVGNPELHPESETFHYVKRNIHLDSFTFQMTFRIIHLDLGIIHLAFHIIHVDLGNIHLTFRIILLTKSTKSQNPNYK